MSMRLVECNICGEPLAAANDDELLRRLKSHFESEHSSTGFDENEARETISREAYSATDS